VTRGAGSEKFGSSRMPSRVKSSTIERKRVRHSNRLQYRTAFGSRLVDEGIVGAVAWSDVSLFRANNWLPISATRATIYAASSSGSLACP
jgi:hypothetical protein